MRRSRSVAITSCAFAIACGGAPIGDFDADGAGLVEEGSAEARAILAVVNDATFTELDREIGLDRRAAQNISDYVRGPDERLGSRDDDPITSIAELDAIKYVGARAITQLLEYTERSGPSAVTVEGVSFTAAQARAVLDFVNLASGAQLDDDIGLNSRAASSIMASRPIESIEDLAAVRYVGATALGQLRDGVTAQDGGERPAAEIEGVVLTGAELHGILDLVNRATLEQLDDEAGLDGRAASNIVRSRPLASVEALAAVSYVGASAIEKLRDYAAIWTPPAGGTTSPCEVSLRGRRFYPASRMTRMLLAAADGAMPFAQVTALHSSGCNDLAGDSNARRAMVDALWLEAFGVTGRSVVRDVGPFTPGGGQYSHALHDARRAIELAVLNGAWDPDADRSAGPLYDQIDDIVAALEAEVLRSPRDFVEVRLNREDGACGQSVTALIDLRDGTVLMIHRLPAC